MIPVISNTPSSDAYYSEGGDASQTTHSNITVPVNESLVVCFGTRESDAGHEAATVTFAGQAVADSTLESTGDQSSANVFTLHSRNITTHTGDIVVAFADSRNSLSVIYLFVQNLHLNNSIEASTSTAITSSNVSHIAGPLTVLRNSLILFQNCHRASQDNTGVPSGYTEVFDFTDAPDGTGSQSHYLATKIVAAGGVNASATLTLNAAKLGVTQMVSLHGKLDAEALLER